MLGSQIGLILSMQLPIRGLRIVPCRYDRRETEKSRKRTPRTALRILRQQRITAKRSPAPGFADVKVGKPWQKTCCLFNLISLTYATAVESSGLSAGFRVQEDPRKRLREMWPNALGRTPSTAIRKDWVRALCGVEQGG